MSLNAEENFEAHKPAEHATVPPVGESPRTDSMSDHEKSLLAKVGEVAEDTVKRLKEIFTEVDREELRKSVNREQIQRSVASTLDTLNAKAQAFLTPKSEDVDSSEPKSDPLHSEVTLETSPEAPGPVGTEAVNHDEAPRHSTVNPPENETRSFT